jgi:hypothetical protein
MPCALNQLQTYPHASLSREDVTRTFMLSLATGVNVVTQTNLMMGIFSDLRLYMTIEIKRSQRVISYQTMKEIWYLMYRLATVDIDFLVEPKGIVRG